MSSFTSLEPWTEAKLVLLALLQKEYQAQPESDILLNRVRNCVQSERTRVGVPEREEARVECAAGGWVGCGEAL